jgi:class 3 adenylate cyclase
VSLERSGEKGDLLVVDDNRVNRLLVARTLEQFGHRLAFAENGRRALAALHSRPADLVLLDIEMPELNGYQTLEALRADPKLRDIPVVMMSSVDEVDSVARCIELGAEDYLFKPVNAVLLRARVASSLGKKRLRDQEREFFRKFATAEVAEELLTTGYALGGKHVDATVMFADIRGFTSLAASLPPAETIDLLNNYYTLMFDAIGGQGGTVNQMLGDGLMALFGAPLPHADHAERAVRAGLEMLELVAGFSREQAARGKPEIRIGIGIASGLVIAGYTGSERRVTYTCVGDTVSLAARLEAHTKVLGRPVLIEECTRAAVSSVVSLEDHGPVQLDTRVPSVRVYSVHGILEDGRESAQSSVDSPQRRRDSITGASRITVRE